MTNSWYVNRVIRDGIELCRFITNKWNVMEYASFAHG